MEKKRKKTIKYYCCSGVTDDRYAGVWRQEAGGGGSASCHAKQPILWRVLDREGDDVFLVADRALALKKYHETNTDVDVTWECSTLRSWLNGYGSASNTCGKNYQSDGFLLKAFSAQEREAIKDMPLSNKSLDAEVPGGGSTRDKVFCLSCDDMSESGYGFLWYNSLNQVCGTEYVLENNADSSNMGNNGEGTPDNPTDSPDATLAPEDHLLPGRQAFVPQAKAHVKLHQKEARKI